MLGAEGIEHLRVEEWGHCERCPLHETRTNLVFGEGNPDADLMIIGQGPGEEEDASGRIFVGQEGQVLDQFLEAPNVELDRQEDIYLTNLVCCRPFTENQKLRRGQMVTIRENRAPSTPEREACWDRLYETIYRVDPYLIITMGKTALSALLGGTKSITAMRGRMATFTMKGRETDIRYPVLPTFLLSHLLRNRDTGPEGPWAQVGSDFVEARMVLDYLREVYQGITPEEH